MRSERYAAQDEIGNKPSVLRVVTMRGDAQQYSVSIPVRNGTVSLVLPGGYVSWPSGKPYPDPIRLNLGDVKTLWINFGFSREFGFYVSLKTGYRRENGTCLTNGGQNSGLCR
jgi:hypothetical protein